MRSLRLFDPLSDFNQLRREIERTFDAFRESYNPRGAFLPGVNPRSYPQINICENDDNVYVEALAPGLDPEKIEINVLRNQLSIAGEKAPASENVDKAKVHRAERAAGRFVRSFNLPAQVDEAKVTAEYNQGVLKITLPKAEAAKPKKIAVAVA